MCEKFLQYLQPEDFGTRGEFGVPVKLRVEPACTSRSVPTPPVMVRVAAAPGKIVAFTLLIATSLPIDEVIKPDTVGAGVTEPSNISSSVEAGEVLAGFQLVELANEPLVDYSRCRKRLQQLCSKPRQRLNLLLLHLQNVPSIGNWCPAPIL